MSTSSRRLHLKAEPVAQLTSLRAEEGLGFVVGCRSVVHSSIKNGPAMVCEIVLWQALLILKPTQLLCVLLLKSLLVGAVGSVPDVLLGEPAARGLANRRIEHERSWGAGGLFGVPKLVLSNVFFPRTIGNVGFPNLGWAMLIAIRESCSCLLDDATGLCLQDSSTSGMLRTDQNLRPGVQPKRSDTGDLACLKLFHLTPVRPI